MKQLPIFITSNAHKAQLFKRGVQLPIEHQPLELDELQSLDLHEIVEHKARQAHALIGKPVLVEDVALRLSALNGLPGPLIKWFLQKLELEKIAALAQSDPRASAEVCYCYFDGENLKFFDGKVEGSIVKVPRGTQSFGFSPIFTPNGHAKTYGEMDEEETDQFGLRTTTVYPELHEYFSKS